MGTKTSIYMSLYPHSFCFCCYCSCYYCCLCVIIYTNQQQRHDIFGRTRTTQSSKKTDLVNFYARHLCLIDVDTSAFYIYMHCTTSRNKTDLVYQHLCSIEGGPSASSIYMHCARSIKKTNVVYWYARHLCSIDGGPSACYIYICIVLDLSRKLM